MLTDKRSLCYSTATIGLRHEMEGGVKMTSGKNKSPDGDRLRKLRAKDPVFPFDKGFNRFDEVDISEVR